MHTFSDSGISVRDNITLSVSRKILPLKHIILAFTAALGCYGGMFTFLSYFEFSINKAMLIMYMTAFFIIFTVILNLPGRLKLLILPASILYETIFVRQRELFINGFKSIYNVMAQRLRITGEGIMYYRIDADVDQTLASTSFFIFAGFIYMLVITYAVYCRPHFIAGLLVSFAPVEIGLYFGLKPSYPAFIAVAAYWAATVALGVSGCRDGDSRSTAGFIRKGNDFYAKSHIKFSTGEFTGFITIVATVLIFAAAMLFVKFSGYERSEKIDNLRSNIKTAVSEFTIYDVPASMNRISTSFGNFSAAPGKLGQFSDISYKNQTDLRLTFDRKLYSEIYFKCFTGSYYSENQWNDFPKSVYKDNQQLFDLMQANNLYPQDFLNFSAAAVPDSAECMVKVSQLAKNPRYLYLPYGADTSGFERKRDSSVKSDTLREYSTSFQYIGSYEDFLSSGCSEKTDISESFSETEQQYREFVYNNYLQIPDNHDVNAVRQKYSGVIENCSGKSYEDVYSVMNRIRNVIAFDTEYTLSPGRTPATRDFVSYFLLENKKGYCSHYASAGILLARMCGIPARYAEGYIVTDSDFSFAVQNADGSCTIDVKDSRAHAWAEIYIDGFGWIPFEFTPGYDAGIVAAETTAPPKVTVVINETVTETAAASETTGQAAETSVSEEETTAPASETSSVSSDTSQTQSAGGFVSDDRNNNSKNSLLTVIILSAAFIVIIISAFLIRRQINTNKRRKSFATENSNQNAVNAYLYMITLLGFLGIENNSNMTYLDFAEYAEKNSGFFHNGEFVNATKTALESDLSNHQISEKDAEKVVRLAEKFAAHILSAADVKQKFYLKYISNFI